MILYHSSNIDFEAIDLGMSKPNKDFGRAFYLSANASEIEPVGKAKVILQGGCLIMKRYEFDESHLSDGSLKAKIFDGYSMEWAEFMALLPMILWVSRYVSSGR